jgi:hypothetical protein
MALTRGFLFEATFARIIEAGLLRWQPSRDGNAHPACIARSAMAPASRSAKPNHCATFRWSRFLLNHVTHAHLCH